MAEDDPSADLGQPAPGTTPVDAVRRPRRWSWVVGILLLLLAGLALLLPTLASSAPGRALIVGEINSRLNGHIELQNASLGWFSGLRLNGLAIFDASGRQILQVAHVDSGFSLWRWIRGRYVFGETHVDGLDILLSREAHGSFNWGQLLRRVTTGSAGGAEQSLPWTSLAVSGQWNVSRASLTYEDRALGQSDFVRHAHGRVMIGSDRRSIVLSLVGEVQVGSNPPTAISIDGSARVPTGATIAAGESLYSMRQTLVGRARLRTDRFVDSDLGITLSGVDLPVSFHKGIARMLSSRPAAGVESEPSLRCNGGDVHLAGVELDLRGPNILIAMPDHLKLMRGVALNPAFASWMLGGVLKNPLFVRTERADGRLNVTVDGEERNVGPALPKELVIPLSGMIDDAQAATQRS